MRSNLFDRVAYTDERVFRQELQTLLSDTWHFCGLTEDLQQAGQYMTVQAGVNNILVYRDSKRILRAHHNLCRHRGMRLREGRGQLNGSITCPYHDWTYSQKGELLSVPGQRKEFAGMDKACLSLRPAQVGIWRGMIWVHPDPGAPCVEDYFAPMTPHLAPYDVETLIEATDYVYEDTIKANWKLVVENYIDHYHLMHLHAGTLSMYDHRNADFGFVGNHFHFWEPLAKDYYEGIEKQAPYPLLIEKNHPRIGAWVPMLFPCIGLVETESSWSVFHIVPVAVDETKVIIRSKVKNCGSMHFLKQATLSAQYWVRKRRGKYPQLDKSHPLGSGDIMKEDIYVCEQLQQALSSPYFEFGPSAENGESPIRGFQQRVKAKLQAVS